MSTPFLGELKIFSFGFAPKGWAHANGQILSVGQNPALFSLFGVMYGGDGQTTFGIPNLQGGVPVHPGDHAHFKQGSRGGAARITLGVQEIPAHTHTLTVSRNNATSTDPANLAPAVAGANIYGDPGVTNYFDPSAVPSSGGGRAHNNMPPYLVVNWCVALAGTFPKVPDSAPATPAS